MAKNVLDMLTPAHVKVRLALRYNPARVPLRSRKVHPSTWMVVLEISEGDEVLGQCAMTAAYKDREPAEAHYWRIAREHGWSITLKAGEV